MSSAFVLAPIDASLPALPSEAQEVINILSAAGWTVQLMQDQTTRLELYRLFDRGQYDLGWIGAHSGPEGWALQREVLPPDVLGNFMALGGCTELVLNSCYSAPHVGIIQARAARCNIVATIQAEGIEDREAWSGALSLARWRVKTGSLRAAARQAGGQYRWFPAPSSEVDSDGGGMDNKAVEERLRRNEELVGQLVRALQGEQFTGQPGLITTLAKHQLKMEEYIEKNEEWKESIEDRFNQHRLITLTPQGALVIIVGGVLFVLFVLLMTRLLSTGGLL